MRKILLTLAITLLTTITGYSQYYVDYGFSVGASNYLGEIGGGVGERRDGFVDMKLNYSRWTLGGFYRYRVSPKIGVKGSLNYIRLSGDDAKTDNPHRRGRNLNFRNDMFELLANGELYIYKVNDVGRTGRYTSDFNLYFYGGVGLFYSNPKGQAPSGNWVSLQPLQTEGVSYSRFNFTIPVGIGFYYTIERKYRLGMEIGWRTTFTDYIDDVSTVYVAHDDPYTASLANKNNQAIIDQIREDNPDAEKLPSVNTYQPGDKRGDPEHDDAYVTATVNFSWAIRGRSKFYRAKHSWVLGRKKRRRRKSRAKF
ncbi:MAG: outer membrane beta-barrel protein [Flavobacteriales bacterium]|nr:outer membrane beta-barrel protein [Flavobacteriales bacterium]